MTAGRIVKLSILAALLLALLLLGGLYLQANRIPENYQPVSLTPDQKEQAVKHFYRDLQNFHNSTQMREPFSITVTQRQLNSYLASMDDIAAVPPGRQRGEVSEAMRRMGIYQPAVSLEDGSITLMIFAKQYSKILSAEVSFEFTSDQRVGVDLDSIRLGKLSVPKGLVSDWLVRQQSAMAPDSRLSSTEPPTRSLAGVAAVLATVVVGIDAEEIPTVLKLPRGNDYRVKNLQITDGNMTLYFEPVAGAR